MRRTLLNFVVAMMLACFAVSALASEKTGSYLYIQKSNAGILQATKKAKQYKLILTQLSPYVVYYSHRPTHSTGMMPVAKFFKQWHHGKAALQAINMSPLQNGQTTSLMLMLFHPKYDSKRHTVSYDARLIKGKPDRLPTVMKFKYVALLLNPICSHCSD